jgi:hypothetical protein
MLTIAPPRHSPRTAIHHQQDEQHPADNTAETDPDPGSGGELLAGRAPIWLFCIDQRGLHCPMERRCCGDHGSSCPAIDKGITLPLTVVVPPLLRDL